MAVPHGVLCGAWVLLKNNHQMVLFALLALLLLLLLMLLLLLLELDLELELEEKDLEDLEEEQHLNHRGRRCC